MEENPKSNRALQLYNYYYKLVHQLNNIKITLELCSISLIIATFNEDNLIDIYATNASVFFLLSFLLSPISKLHSKKWPLIDCLVDLPAIFTGFGFVSLILIVYEYARKLNMIDKIGQIIFFFVFLRICIFAIIFYANIFYEYTKKYNSFALKALILEIIATYAIGLILMFLILCISIGSFLVVGWDPHLDLYILEGISNVGIYRIGILIVFINSAAADRVEALCKNEMATRSQRMFKSYSSTLLIGVSLLYLSQIFHYIGAFANEMISTFMLLVGLFLVCCYSTIFKLIHK